MERKILCLILALFTLCGVCLADRAAVAGTDVFFIAAETDGDVLIRFGEDGAARAVQRAAEISCVCEKDGAVYYLACDGGAWSLMRRTGGAPETAYAFEAGKEASDLCFCGGNLLVLIDGQLHMLYPDMDLAIKLAGTKMDAFAADGDDIYYIPRGENGLSVLSLATGKTRALTAEKAEDMLLTDGSVYYRAPRGIRRIDTAAGRIEDAAEGYDWGFCVLDGRLLVRRAGGLFTAEGTLARPMEDIVEMAPLGRGAVLFDPVGMTCAVIGG